MATWQPRDKNKLRQRRRNAAIRKGEESAQVGSARAATNLVFGRMEQLAARDGLRLVACSENHWQVKDGRFLVNFYPSKGTMYIDGTNTGIGNVSWQNAVQAASKLPLKLRGRGAKRKSTYRVERQILLNACAECVYCQRPLNINTSTLDHIIPLAAGGGNVMSNYALACLRCNSDKASKITQTNREVISGRRERVKGDQ